MPEVLSQHHNLPPIPGLNIRALPIVSQTPLSLTFFRSPTIPKVMHVGGSSYPHSPPKLIHLILFKSELTLLLCL